MIAAELGAGRGDLVASEETVNDRVPVGVSTAPTMESTDSSIFGLRSPSPSDPPEPRTRAYRRNGGEGRGADVIA